MRSRQDAGQGGYLKDAEGLHVDVQYLFTTQHDNEEQKLTLVRRYEDTPEIIQLPDQVRYRRKERGIPKEYLHKYLSAITVPFSGFHNRRTSVSGDGWRKKFETKIEHKDVLLFSDVSF